MMQSILSISRPQSPNLYAPARITRAHANPPYSSGRIDEYAQRWYACRYIDDGVEYQDEPDSREPLLL